MYEKEVLISLDLSTVCCGYCITDFKTEKIIELSYYKFKAENILDKMVELENILTDLFLNKYTKIHYFILEERLKSFRAGGTNADAMLKLAIFNFTCQFILYKLGIKLKEINVSTARKLAFPLFHSIVRKTNIKQKEFAFQLVLKELGESYFPTKVNKSGKNKGNTVFLNESQDISDSYVLNKAAIKILKGIS